MKGMAADMQHWGRRSPRIRLEIPVRSGAIAMLVLVTCTRALAMDPHIVPPYEADTSFIPANKVDECVLASLKGSGIRHAYLCSDEVFIRRVFLDVIGTLPEPEEVRAFCRDENPDKRAQLIESLFHREEFADYWAMKWCDLLRVKSEFPINLWPNAVQAYHHWIRESVANNKPYNEFVRELLTSSGSNFRVPQVNFYRAVQGHDPATLASAVALTFMGSRLESWPDDRRAGMVSLFSRLAFKPTAEWKEEIVYLDPAATTALEAMLPDGTPVRINAGDDPRRVFADWLVAPENPWFARNVANRIWAWLMGRGIINEPDDIRPDNPPVNPELLAYLEAELVKSDFDLLSVYRLILNSRTYQQSSIPRSDKPEAEAQFAFYPVRRLDAEVLIDALDRICGSHEEYTSAIPEPFTYIPKDQPTIALADGSISSPFLELFGRPARDTGMESERDNRVTNEQRLHLLNSSHVQEKIEKSQRIRRIVRSARGSNAELVRSLYLLILSREPTRDELAAAEQYVQRRGPQREQDANDLVWALLNSKEFLYRH